MVDNVLQIGQSLATLILRRAHGRRWVVDGVDEIAPAGESGLVSA
jgi:hypothetical protein